MVPLPQDLHPEVLKALARRGVDSLWGHQAEALEAAFEGPTIVTTGTASGKSLCFQLPTLQTIATAPMARALYLYPSKALAQDQARALHAFGMKRLQPAIYDGDTPREHRAELRRRANLILTNPDMLHIGILPNHAQWERFFSGLAVVVIDEAHVYRGVFGSHVANVIRRLRRICEFYGTVPRFLLASATVANPRELARAADRAGGDPRGGPRRLPRHAPHDRDVEPADGRRGDRRGGAPRCPRPPTCSSGW